MYIHRAAEAAIRRVSKMFGAVLLTGPRQVGKTTMLKELAEPERRYVTLDDLNVRTLAQTDPPLFLARYTPPVLIDEIQYAPELLPYIKMDVDACEEKGRYWLTGSQAFHSMRNVSESLAGRFGIINLLGLSHREIAGRDSQPFSTNPTWIVERMRTAPQADLKGIYERIFIGGMPALSAQPQMDRELFFSSYLSTYIERDIRDLTQVADEGAFLRFMVVVAAHTARPLVMQELAQEAEISVTTAKRWLSVLTASHIVALVQPFHNNVLTRTVKMPLLHFLDTGLCAYLTGWTSSEVLERGAMSGQVFESWVFSELYKSYLNAGRRPLFFYYRDK
ncbi:MAG: ATP-binding protein, partial [Coriobacteriales bacterium]|nr:ATP-binding protein [Coriobacteriales bacterium]